MDIREVSEFTQRFFFLSGMKKHVTSIIPNKYPQVESYITKSKCTPSIYCGGESSTNLHVVVHADKNFTMKK